MLVFSPFSSHQKHSWDSAVPACYSNSCSLIIWQTNHAWDSKRFSRRFKGRRRHSRDYNELVKCATLQSRASQFEWLMIIVSGTRQVHCQSQLALRCLHFLSWRTIEDTHTWDDSETMRSDPGWSACFVNFLYFDKVMLTISQRRLVHTKRRGRKKSEKSSSADH